MDARTALSLRPRRDLHGPGTAPGREIQHSEAAGGFLIALNDEAEHGGVSAETFQLYREAIISEFTRAGLRESYLREAVNWLVSRLGQEFDARGIAADTDIGSRDTARNSIDHLVSAYVAEVFHRTPDLERFSPAFRSPRKLHSGGPLLWHLIRAWTASDPGPWPTTRASLGRPEEIGYLAEWVVAIHLRRAFGERIFNWRPDERREIDFVVAPPGVGVALAEVKCQSRIDDRDVRTLARAGGGLLLSRDLEGVLADALVHAVPAGELLALPHAPVLGRAPR